MPSCLLLQLPSLVGPVVLTQIFFFTWKKKSVQRLFPSVFSSQYRTCVNYYYYCHDCFGLYLCLILNGTEMDIGGRAYPGRPMQQSEQASLGKEHEVRERQFPPGHKESDIERPASFKMKCQRQTVYAPHDDTLPRRGVSIEEVVFTAKKESPLQLGRACAFSISLTQWILLSWSQSSNWHHGRKEDDDTHNKT